MLGRLGGKGDVKGTLYVRIMVTSVEPEKTVPKEVAYSRPPRNRRVGLLGPVRQASGVAAQPAPPLRRLPSIF